MRDRTRPFRVLSIDGGGMRGLYSATYLTKLSKRYENTCGEGPLDIGKGFDLVAATSTGAIIGCALAAGVPPEQVAKLYRDCGPRVFPAKLPARVDIRNLTSWLRVPFRSRQLKAGASALRKALYGLFEQTTVASIWEERRIARWQSQQ